MAVTYDAPEIECAECLGEGWTLKRNSLLGPGWYETDCPHCNGHGWREMTDDELADAAERQEQDRSEDFHDGGGQPSLDEQHTAAWQQKQGLRR